MKEKLGQILVRCHELSENQIQTALLVQQRSDKRLGAICMELGFIDEFQLQKALAQQFDIPAINLSMTPPDNTIECPMGVDWMRREEILPLWHTPQGKLVVGVVDPLNLQAWDTLSAHMGGSLQKAIVTPGQLKAVLDALSTSGKSSLRTNVASPGTDEATQIVEEVDNILAHAIRQGASDIHIEPTRELLRIRLRRDGTLHEYRLLPDYFQQALVTRIKVMAEMDIAEKRLPQDGKFHWECSGKQYDIRVSTLRNIHGEGAVLRILQRSQDIPDFQQLGMEPRDCRTAKDLFEQPGGIVLICGPTGSGKTTTLYSALQLVNRMDRKIITIEDPVEYQLPLINQVQVNVKAGMDFSVLLPSLLRQDPDIIVIGEIRDHKTAAMACQAALTGHLVISTIHTTSAAEAATRLVDIGVEPFLVSSSLRGVIAQRLVRCLCSDCADWRAATPEEQRWLGKDPGQPLGHPVGCDQCWQGYRGRSGIFEILVMNDTVQEHIQKHTPAPLIYRQLQQDGSLVSLGDDVRTKVSRGITSIAEATRVLGREGDGGE
ncbi:GspE/PulE family protein [Desulfurispira natronophila]|uniref:Type II secretory ATPase GspE/PulE/Tfp pilus assembly ATPase PilB-like protein n=1 Tax=Desulfurispira natronophila TaxID=682562 RepID=A0A7W7Y599_9BACT|nr:GspE/PulE family protein [Desulfurispira natronophila]MBB5022047.1 type II secretory ATPase GspE/PulE/Tfp pilus assembly ATPase PilB-like protein [Desulfurispira natronophila]